MSVKYIAGRIFSLSQNLRRMTLGQHSIEIKMTNMRIPVGAGRLESEKQQTITSTRKGRAASSPDYNRRMAVFVNNKSALRFWCNVMTSLDDVCDSTTICDVKNASTSIEGIPEEELAKFDIEKHKLHVLVPNASQRRSSKNMVCHARCLPYPNGAFRRCSHGVYVASPELCFFEMASSLPFFKLVEFGFLLCGTYTLNPAAVDPNCRQPLSSKRKLSSFIDRMGTARGCKVARKALSLVLEGSASVRETKTAILLCAPTKMGGYGFKAPEMNYRIDFSEEEQRMFGRPYVVLDLYLSEYHFGIEYDGEKGHSEERDLSRDRRKSSELNYCGINVVRVDKEQLANAYQVYVLAKKCMRIMGLYLRKPTKEQWNRKQDLFDAVMR